METVGLFVYQIRGEIILIVAVMHLRRHPDPWKSRLAFHCQNSVRIENIEISVTSKQASES
jgi:hypothetical protein